MAHEDFDWVMARDACSLPKCFAALKAQVGHDVETRNRITPAGGSGATFELGDNGDSFIVLTERHDHNGRSVTFKLTKDCIEVVDAKGNLKFRATLTLNAERECMFRIAGDDEEYDSWYIRKKALEDIFFRRP